MPFNTTYIKQVSPLNPSNREESVISKPSIESCSPEFQQSFARLSDLVEPIEGTADELAEEKELIICDHMSLTFAKFCNQIEQTVTNALTNNNVSSAEKSEIMKQASSSASNLLQTGKSRRHMPGLVNHRNMRRVSSGFVRPAGKTAACYCSRDNGKFKFTIEARIMCDANTDIDDYFKSMSTSLLAMPMSESLSQNSINAYSSTPALPINPSHPQNFKKIGENDSSCKQQDATIADQINQVKIAITSMAKSIPPLIPGSPIYLFVNAIVTYRDPNFPDIMIKRPYTWQGIARTPDGSNKIVLRQQILEAAFKAQGVDIASSEGYAIPKRNGILGKVLGIFGSRTEVSKRDTAIS